MNSNTANNAHSCIKLLYIIRHCDSLIINFIDVFLTS